MLVDSFNRIHAMLVNIEYLRTVFEFTEPCDSHFWYQLILVFFRYCDIEIKL